MNKAEFLTRLRAALGKLPMLEIEQSIAFYSEVIDDRMEDGLSEHEAVASLGDINQIAAQIIAETPAIPRAVAKANTGNRTLNIVLLIVFSPIWVPLAFSLIMAALSVYFALWMTIVALWVAVVCMFVAGLVAIVSMFVLVATGFPLPGLLCLGWGLAIIGIGLFCVFGVFAASKGLFSLSKRFARWIRSLFLKEGGAQ